MLTKHEIVVLQNALQEWTGLYSQDSILNNKEKDYSDYLFSVRVSLLKRFEEILQHYQTMENSHLS